MQGVHVHPQYLGILLVKLAKMYAVHPQKLSQKLGVHPQYENHNILAESAQSDKVNHPADYSARQLPHCT